MHPLATPELTRIYAVANLLALRQRLETGAQPVTARRADRHARPRRTRCGAPRFDHRIDLGERPGSAAATLDEVARRAPTGTSSTERSNPSRCPISMARSVQQRIFRQAQFDNEINTVASMLPARQRAAAAAGASSPRCCRRRRSTTSTPRRWTRRSVPSSPRSATLCKSRRRTPSTCPVGRALFGSGCSTPRTIPAPGQGAAVVAVGQARLRQRPAAGVARARCSDEHPHQRQGTVERHLGV